MARSIFQCPRAWLTQRYPLSLLLKNKRLGSTLATKPVVSVEPAKPTQSPPLSSQAPSPLSFYRRELPPSLLPFNSTEGKTLFKESLLSGHAESYFNLVGNFTTQTEPTYCGLGSLAMVLNALEMDPGRNWKGVWRWYSDEMIECCPPLTNIKEKGITFHEFDRLANCNGLHTISKRWDRSSLDEFTADLYKTSTLATTHLVVAFNRQTLGQTGIGHFSPIGAIHPTKRLALVLDVARFKYPSYWVPIDMMWRAMEPIDQDTGLPRGYFLLTRKSRATSILVKLKEEYQWPPTKQLEQSSHVELKFVESQDPVIQQEMTELQEELERLFLHDRAAHCPANSHDSKGVDESEAKQTALLQALSRLIVQPASLRPAHLSPLLAGQIERISQQLNSYNATNRHCTCQQKTRAVNHA